MNEQLLSTKQVATRLGLAPITLRKWRMDPAIGLPFVKFGHRVMYRPTDVEAFINARLMASTSKAAA